MIKIAGVELRDYQEASLKRMHNGCILCGGVGSGKSRTGLAFYYTMYGGKVNTGDYVRMSHPADLYIITTARKRDTLEWNDELLPFMMYPGASLYQNKVVIDSWNNITKYRNVKRSFFIFDEQRAVGHGSWAKALIDIAKNNLWIMLSATPGDRWEDYCTVFVANGFYKNKTDFEQQHIIWDPYLDFPRVQGYRNTRKLMAFRDKLLVTMDFDRKTVPHNEYIYTKYDKMIYKTLIKERWNFETDEPIESANELVQLLRKICNTDPTRINAYIDICKSHRRVIVFYNFNYELDILKSVPYEPGTVVSEWNGHKHEPIPDSLRWVFLVQYNAGSEGWNCISTDTIIFYSENYSYRMMAQAAGRTDRMNTPFTDLWYYHLTTKSSVDIKIDRALKQKKNFNERGFLKSVYGKDFKL